MDINARTLDLTFKGFQTIYSDAFSSADINWDKIAMTVPSTSREETYGWFGQFPQLREWIGPRQINKLEAHSFKIINRHFESTVAVKRNDFMDDSYGVYKPAFSEMGYLARLHPEELIFNLLGSGFTEVCYDGKPFFSEEHPSRDKEDKPIQISNVLMEDPGSQNTWYLLDTSRAVRPIVWQEREDYRFVSKTDEGSENVFMNREYLYGVSARVNAGFGLWQLAFASNTALTAENFSIARSEMMKRRADGGRLLGIKPTTLVVPPELEHEARILLKTQGSTLDDANPWVGAADLIVSPYLSSEVG